MLEPLFSSASCARGASTTPMGLQTHQSISSSFQKTILVVDNAIEKDRNPKAWNLYRRKTNVMDKCKSNLPSHNMAPKKVWRWLKHSPICQMLHKIMLRFYNHQRFSAEDRQRGGLCRRGKKLNRRRQQSATRALRRPPNFFRLPCPKKSADRRDSRFASKSRKKKGKLLGSFLWVISMILSFTPTIGMGVFMVFVYKINFECFFSVRALVLLGYTLMLRLLARGKTQALA